MQLRESFRTATILINDTTSDVVPLRARMVVGFIMPAAFTGTTITFTGCATVDGTFVGIRDSNNNPVSVTVVVSTGYGLSGAEADAVAAFPFIRLVSGSTEVAARSITVLMK